MGGRDPSGKITRTYAHGTLAKYKFEGCRCTPCRLAKNEYERRRYRLAGYGRPAHVPAGPVREHVKSLMATPSPGSRDGIGYARIAKLAGVSRGAVARLIYGEKGKETKRIKRETAERLMKVRADQRADRTLVDASDTWGYVTELLDLGFQKACIARAIGRKDGDLRLGKRRVTVRTARAVEDLHWKVFVASAEFRKRCAHPMPDRVADELEGRAGAAELRRRAGLDQPPTPSILRRLRSLKTPAGTAHHRRK